MWLSYLALTAILEAATDESRTSRISDETVPLIQPESFVQRPRPLLELGNPLLGTGNIEHGFEVPGGAVWQPQLIVYGSLRSALQHIDRGNSHATEWANRLELLANLQLTGTERIVLGVRPLDEEGVFSGYRFDGEDGSISEFNDEITTLFFEGEIGELAPNLDPTDGGSFDIGFALGRQPIAYQEGMLIDDDLDALGLIHNTLLPDRGSDFQMVFLYAWDEIHRADLREARDADLYGVFAAWDLPKSTVRADLALVDDERGDSLHAGVEAVQRIGHFNTAFRLVGSAALDQESAIARDGLVLMTEISWTPAWTHDNVYLNAFLGVDEYTPAAVRPATRGPLRRTGILFEGAGLGTFDAALNNQPDDSLGAAFGYQRFSSDTRSQWVIELAAHESRGTDDTQFALGARYQKAFGQRHVLRFDGFIGDSDLSGSRSGVRTEWVVRF